MDAHKILAKSLKTNAKWQESLNRHDEAAYTREPEGGGWTLGQICDHITTASTLFLDTVTSITSGEGEERGGGLLTKIMFAIGSLPPGRFKVPKELPEHFQPLQAPNSLTKQEALDRMRQVEGRTKELCEVVAASPKNQRSRHPAAGQWFNASQWYQLSEMHMRHHLRQLRRLEKQLG